MFFSFVHAYLMENTQIENNDKEKKTERIMYENTIMVEY